MVNILNTIRLGRGVRLFGLAFIPLLSFVSLFAQQGGTGVCQGGVTDAETHRALEGVLVRDASGYHGAVTDAEGRYTVALPAGRYKLTFSCLGYTSQTLTVTVGRAGTTPLDVALRPDDSQLSEVVVTSKSAAQRLREAPSAVTVVDASALRYHMATLNEVLDKTAGVHVARQGGMGSMARILVQGLDGKRIGVFVNGVPMGSSEEFSLGSIPPDMVQEVEIYKGIVPAYLGGDGLGGAVNIILKDFQNDHLEAAYGIGSYHTHTANFQAKKYLPTAGLAVRVGGSFDYSKNDYTFNSPFELGRIIRRDHDAYRRIAAEVGVAFTRLPLDHAELSVGYENLYDEIQGGLMNVQNNIRHAFSRYNSLNISQALSKRLADGRFSILLNASQGLAVANQVDTSHYSYDFLGNRFLSSSVQGEVGSLPNDSRDRYTNLQERLNANYRFNEVHALNANITHRYNRKLPKDDLADSYSRFPTGGYPSQLHAIVAGLTYELHLAGGRWVNEAGIKLFYYRSEVMPSPERVVLQEKLTAAKNAQAAPGWSEAIAWHPSEALTVKASVQSLRRMPTADEMFGNGVLIYPSYMLRPEQSLNMNLGAGWIVRSGRYPHARIEVNAFYMHLTDMIKMMYGTMYMAYENIGRARITGVEGSVDAGLFPWLDVRGNVSWQDARDTRRDAVGGGSNFHYNYRIPNTPYFFGNCDINLHTDHLLGRRSHSALTLGFEFTHRFNYNWEAPGDRSSMEIPSKYEVNVGLHHAFTPQWQLGLEVRNLFDRENWGEYRYPLEKRTLHFKVKYTLNKLNTIKE